jgi:uncharacterized SAM-binding protein YcdF (DUF218 family)
LLAWGEWENWCASRRALGVASEGLQQTVVVLGYRNRGSRANLVNRWRVRAGLRSLPVSGAARLIFAGGTAGVRRSEAWLMADYARAECGYQGEILLEEVSLTTWENVCNVAALLEEADQIKIVSHPFHAYKARVYLHRERPDLARRLAQGRDYQFGEWLPAKPLLAAYGRWTTRALKERAAV